MPRYIIAGRAKRRTSPSQITLFESPGMALEDVDVGAEVLHLARELGVGTHCRSGEPAVSNRMVRAG